MSAPLLYSVGQPTARCAITETILHLKLMLKAWCCVCAKIAN